MFFSQLDRTLLSEGWWVDGLESFAHPRHSIYTSLKKMLGQALCPVWLACWQAMVADFSGDPYDTDKVGFVYYAVLSNKPITCVCDFHSFSVDDPCSTRMRNRFDRVYLSAVKRLNGELATAEAEKFDEKKYDPMEPLS